MAVILPCIYTLQLTTIGPVWGEATMPTQVFLTLNLIWLCLEMHSESSLYSLCLTWPQLELCLTDRRYNNKLFALAYIEVFKFADNLVDSRLEITYPLALISSPNWRTQQQRAKIRDIFALCFRHEALLIVQQYMKHAIYINIIYIFCLFN